MEQVTVHDKFDAVGEPRVQVEEAAKIYGSSQAVEFYHYVARG